MDDAASWLAANLDLVPVGGDVLDVACGSGRNALFLARQGWRVHAVDRDAAALGRLRAARDAGEAAVDDGGPRLHLTTECRDLESGLVALGQRAYQAVLVFNYLHRPLMPAIVEAVASGGVLIYETFTTAQASRGHPRNPAFLLAPGELATLVQPLRVLRAREGEFDGKCVASVVAMR